MRTFLAVTRSVFAASVASTVLGCSAAGPLYVEFAAASIPPAADRTRIILMRPDDRYDDYSASRAVVRVNDQEIGQLAYGGFLTVDVAAGDVTVWTSAKNRFGNPLIKSCELRLSTSPGATVFVDVAPRKASILAGVIGSAAGAAAVSAPSTYGIAEIGEAMIVDPLIESAAGEVGAVVVSAAESAGKTCGGHFRLAVLGAEVAHPRLERLRMSE